MADTKEPGSLGGGDLARTPCQAPGTGETVCAEKQDDAAERELAALVRRAEYALTRPWLAVFRLAAVYAVLAGAGAGLRLLLVPGWGIAVAAGVVLVAALDAWWRLARRMLGRRGEPGWARAAEARYRSLPGRIPDAVLQAADRGLGRVRSGRWRSAHLYLRECTADPARHSGLCQQAVTLPMGDRVLVILGEHMAAHPAVAVATVAHETCHPSGWPYHLSMTVARVKLAGWLVIGWAVGWPWLLAAAGILQAATALGVWAVEIGCDLGAARHEGRQAGLAGLAYGAELAAGGRQAQAAPPWQRHAFTVVTKATGLLPHPPLALRRAALRTLAHDQQHADVQAAA